MAKVSWEEWEKMTDAAKVLYFCDVSRSGYGHSAIYELAYHTGLTPVKIACAICILRREGLIERSGVNRGFEKGKGWRKMTRWTAK